MISLVGPTWKFQLCDCWIFLDYVETRNTISSKTLHSGVDFHIQVVGRKNMLVMADWIALNIEDGMKVSSSLECKPLRRRFNKTMDFIYATLEDKKK